MKRLPIGRARGTMLTSYELAQATFTAGARTGWIRYLTAFAAGALADLLAACIRALRAVLLDKDGRGVNWRPLGILGRPSAAWAARA